jgi:L-seryl-tRNA(Ser) seleniumtransferase
MSQSTFRALPSVDRLTRAAAAELADLPHEEIVAIARTVVDESRRDAADDSPPSLERLTAIVVERGRRLMQPRLRPAINASGVIIQTNLGRAPLSQAALAAMRAVAEGYSNLEYDLDAGARGSRYDHLGELLARLTGAEAALAVNNNASAVLLVLAAFCEGREVLVSRGQAVEIGGGFRIPDVLRQSGARLVEVGTTNRTYAHDYAAAITPDTAAILTVHRSNFRIVGFASDPDDHELRHLAHEAGVLWIDDWGSGSLIQPARYGLAAEPTVQDRVAAGCDLVCFSGDKLLGGPQAGLIVGRREWIAKLRRHPLLRALRVDKLTIAALEATLLSYLRGRAEAEIPVWQMIGVSVDSLESRAEQLTARLRDSGIDAEVVESESAVGGGSLPGATQPSRAIALAGSAAELHRRLRRGDPAVIGRIVDDRLLLDLRAVLPEQDESLLDAVTGLDDKVKGRDRETRRQEDKETEIADT